jgi:uncharacterized protein
MDDDRDLQNFSGICRLFPLPRVVLFPHAILPLHIFEPRYRQMTTDALAADGLLTMVQLATASRPGSTLGSPPIETMGCLGRVLQHERLPDGRFNFLLLGRRRVRLRREIPSEKLYRLAEAEILEDVSDPAADDSLRGELIALGREVFERQKPLEPDIQEWLGSELPLGVLTDLMAHALGLPPDLKQSLLAEPHVDRRAVSLLTTLKLYLTRAEPKFPPPFSTN